jgi:hypothetical protein
LEGSAGLVVEADGVVKRVDEDSVDEAGKLGSVGLRATRRYGVARRRKN